jgi:hypothetical protein
VHRLQGLERAQCLERTFALCQERHAVDQIIAKLRETGKVKVTSLALN